MVVDNVLQEVYLVPGRGRRGGRRGSARHACQNEQQRERLPHQAQLRGKESTHRTLQDRGSAFIYARQGRRRVDEVLSKSPTLREEGPLHVAERPGTVTDRKSPRLNSSP